MVKASFGSYAFGFICFFFSRGSKKRELGHKFWDLFKLLLQKTDVFGKYIFLERFIKGFMKRTFLVEEVKNVS